ncbi:LOW QUALITY PROTEIN: histidyl-tRNA synthetase [Geomicrobium sp. JCM 19039]|nr:LOW QUALITY PROTEIN: histidyl-tRNA synthetase [Geomicrobium sp. JCM 19039]
MDYRIPRGTQDILPGASSDWQKIEAIARSVSRAYNYEEIRTPIFETTEVFQRSVGDSTDIVQKEMYTFQDRGGRHLSLRPEGTASVVRSFVENKMYGIVQQPIKLYYTAPMFRYERPESGRMRQFHQFGVEVLGSDDPAIDAEVISLAMDFYKACGLDKLKLVINSLGDKESRGDHRTALVDHFSARIDEFCSDCQSRLESNPMRILDCKVDRDHKLVQTAPSIQDYLNETSVAYFAKVKQLLDAMNIPYVIDPNLVRGLDYYTNTAFEIMLDEPEFGAITTLTGGGRYEGLVEEFGGPKVSGIGFGLSIERVLMALEARGLLEENNRTLDVYVVAVGEEASDYAAVMLRELRQSGIIADKDYLQRKMKAQFKAADRSGAKHVIVIGENELETGAANVKNMETGDQQQVPFEALVSELSK